MVGQQPSLFGDPAKRNAEPDPVRFGTASFASPDWLGTFYPHGLRSSEFIRFYASQFDTVEVDASYYAIPSPTTIAGWVQKTPPHFLFAAKFPRSIVHCGSGPEPDPSRLLLPDATYAERDLFLEVMSRLGDRLGPLLLQLPHFALSEFPTAAAFWTRLDRFLTDLPRQFSYVVEVRNATWIGRELAQLCHAHEVALALVDRVHMPHGDEVLRALGPLPGPFSYIRLLGDRHRIEQISTTWDREVIDHTPRLERWANVLVWLRQRQIPTFVFANNHYAGHAPSTARRLQALFRSRVIESSSEGSAW